MNTDIFFQIGCIETLSASIKGNAQFDGKVTFEPLLDFKQNHYGSWKYYKSCYFEKFSSPITFFVGSAFLVFLFKH